MKKFSFLFVVAIISFHFVHAQEIILPPSIVASAGSSESLNTINISKWRLGEIHIVTLNRTDEEIGSDWDFSIYPNPVNKDLHVQFKMEIKKDFRYEIFEITGKKVLSNETFSALPEEEIKIDVSAFNSGLYLLCIIPEKQENLRAVKFEKQ